jgi:hypothetical protein
MLGGPGGQKKLKTNRKQLKACRKRNASFLEFLILDYLVEQAYYRCSFRIITPHSILFLFCVCANQNERTKIGVSRI